MSHDVERIWSLGFLNGELRSHPDRKLIDHLLGVTKLSEILVQAYNLPVDQKLVKGLSLTHDLGKAHPDFQAYLDNKGSGVNHAAASSWYTYLLTHDIWAAEAVRRHHTHLYNSVMLINDWLPDDETEDKVKNMLRKYLPQWPLPLNTETWKELDDALDNLEPNIGHWLNLRLLYSVLIAADRMDALKVENYEISPVPSFTPLSFKAETPLAKWREKTRQICLENADKINKPGVYTLTLPTGAGKTLLGLEIASRWAKRFNCRSIIYALPFISIVEQNAAEAQKVFGGAVQEDHSLAYAGEKENERDDAGDSSWRKMLTLFRYWREPVVVTTIVQLWEAIFKPNANRTMNFHKLSRAVVILDEPQNIPPRNWKGLSEVLNYLSEELKTTFLFMTATQPHIKASAEIAPVNLSRPFERHRYFVESQNHEIDKLPELLSKHLPVKEDSGLVVLNTRKGAIKAYELMQEIITDAPLLFLSAWMTPWHRKNVLKELLDMEERGIRRYLVATQVIEAGVNVDFNWVFRDMGPLDSIVQVAGRCNRHLRFSKPGKILIAELMSKGKRFADNVYEDIQLFATRETLPRGIEFGEKKAASLVEEYYSRIVQNGFIPEPIFEMFSTGKWENIKPLIIKNTFNEVDVIIEQNEKVRPIYERLQNTHWKLENRHEQKQLMRDLRQYMISIPERYVQLCRLKMMEIWSSDEMEPFSKVFDGRAYFMTYEGVKAGLYNEKIGFIPPETESTDSILIDN